MSDDTKQYRDASEVSVQEMAALLKRFEELRIAPSDFAAYVDALDVVVGAQMTADQEQDEKWTVKDQLYANFDVWMMDSRDDVIERGERVKTWLQRMDAIPNDPNNN